jgi:cell division protein FtsB
MKSLWGPGAGTKYLRIRRTVDISPAFARVLLIAVLFIIGFIFIAGDVGLMKVWSAQRQVQNLRSKISELENKNALLSAEIDRLKSDSFAIEKVAREKYGYLKPGDKVYRIVPVPEKPEKGTNAPGALDTEPAKP